MTEDLIPEKTVVEKFLNKYIVVWIWSVLFGTGTGLFYSATTVAIGSWGPLAAFVAVPEILTLAAALLSLVHLYGSLKYILPLLIQHQRADDPNSMDFLAYRLRRSFFFVIWTALFRGLTAVAQLVLAATSSRF